MKKHKLVLFIIWALALILIQACSQNWQKLEYDANKAPAENPLKVFMPYVGSYEFPYSLEYFYIGMAEIVEGPGNYNWDLKMEPTLNEVAARGHQAVFRVYLDYPRRPLQVPKFILDSGIKMTPYDSHGGGTSPDFNHPLLVKTMLELIAELGKRYDGDPRVGFIEVGMLGHWGEFHSWPRNDELFASNETQNKVLDAYEEAFKTTHLLVSQDIFSHRPMARISDRRIGLHDDVFTRATHLKEEGHFYARVVSHEMTEKWKQVPMGGEITPGQQSCIWDVPSCTPDDYYECVKDLHPTFMLNHRPFTSEWDEEKTQRAIEGSRALGYEFFVSEYYVNKQGDNLNVGMRMQNTGAAPFYYDWPVEVAILDKNNKPIVSVQPECDLRQIIPGEAPVEIKCTLAHRTLVAGTYRVALRIPNRMTDGNPVLLANTTQQEEWLILNTWVK